MEVFAKLTIWRIPIWMLTLWFPFVRPCLLRCTWNINDHMILWTCRSETLNEFWIFDNFVGCAFTLNARIYRPAIQIHTLSKYYLGPDKVMVFWGSRYSQNPSGKYKKTLNLGCDFKTRYLNSIRVYIETPSHRWKEYIYHSSFVFEIFKITNFRAKMRTKFL